MVVPLPVEVFVLPPPIALFTDSVVSLTVSSFVECWGCFRVFLPGLFGLPCTADDMEIGVRGQAVDHGVEQRENQEADQRGDRIERDVGQVEQEQHFTDDGECKDQVAARADQGQEEDRRQ